MEDFTCQASYWVFIYIICVFALQVKDLGLFICNLPVGSSTWLSLE